jgi:hypothetical protein
MEERADTILDSYSTDNSVLYMSEKDLFRKLMHFVCNWKPDL